MTKMNEPVRYSKGIHFGSIIASLSPNSLFIKQITQNQERKIKNRFQKDSAKIKNDISVVYCEIIRFDSDHLRAKIFINRECRAALPRSSEISLSFHYGSLITLFPVTIFRV
jgi:hypothetical protein